jgi:hypothetical protein
LYAIDGTIATPNTSEAFFIISGSGLVITDGLTTVVDLEKKGTEDCGTKGTGDESGHNVCNVGV